MSSKINNIHFEWDEKKNHQNIEKHGLDFETAIQSWLDPQGFFYPDEEHSSPDELREYYFGRIPNGRAICVVHVEKEENLIRIISAFSDKGIEKIYYENI